MHHVDQLNKKFAIAGGVAQFENGQGSLPRLAIKTPDASAHVYLHGAHVTHYQPEGQADVLYLSSKSNFENGKPIRGGVPVIFPWFGPREGDANAPMHGLVRTRAWDVAEVSQNGNSVAAIFTFNASMETRPSWPHEFSLRFTVTVARQLTMALEVQNTGATPFTFADAMHTYFNVGDVRHISIDGLTGTKYADKNVGHQIFTDKDRPLRLTGPTDRVYLDTVETCTIEDPVLRRRIVNVKDVSNTTVVWNPWSDKVGGMNDIEPSEWPRFVCVETCNVRDFVITLKPGETHVTRARIRSEPRT
jgi:glucose-6-phosphate 1-epimerase